METLKIQRKMKRTIAFIGMLVILLIALMCYLLLPDGGYGVVTSNVYYAVVLVVAALVWFTYYIIDWAYYKPRRVYTRGIAMPLSPGSDHFVPWRWWSTTHKGFERLGMEDPLAREEGEGPKVRIYDRDDNAVEFDEDTPSLKRVYEVAEERAGDPSYDSPEYMMGLRRSLNRTIIMAAVTSTFIAAMFAYIAIGIPQMFGYAYGLVFAYIAFGGLVFFIMDFWIDIGENIPKLWARLREISPGDRTPLKTAIGVLTVFLLVITVSMFAAIQEGMRHYDADATETPDPEWTVLEPGSYTGEQINASGPVRVGPGETLTLTGCNLTFDSAPNGQIGLYVAKGGHLEMENTTVTTPIMELGYFFEVHGSAFITGCLLEHIFGNARWDQGDGGLEIYGDDVTVHNTTFRNTLTNAIMVVGTSPDIVDCEFVDIGDDGLEVQTGSPNIVGCTFTNCNYSMVLWGAEGKVEGCTFIDNDRGVYMMGADTDVVNNHFVRTTYSAILKTSDCQGRVEDNRFEDNGNDIVTERWIGIMGTQNFPQVLGYGCIVIPVIVAILGIAVLMIKLRKAERSLVDDAAPGTVDELVYEPPGS